MNPFQVLVVPPPQGRSRTNISQQHSQTSIAQQRPKTPYKGLQLSTSQNFFLQRSQNKRKSTKMTIISAQQDQIMPVSNIQNLPLELLIKAMNRSTIRAISDGENINIADLILDYGFAQSQKTMKSARLRDAQLSQYVQKQYIVQLDQTFRQNCSIFNGTSCSKNQTSNTIVTDKPHDLRFFILKFNFDGNEIVLTALDDTNQTYYINFDLVRVLKMDPDNPQYKSNIFTLYIDGYLTLNLYFTPKASLYCLNTRRQNCGNMKNSQFTKKKLQKCFEKIIERCRATELGIFSPKLSADQTFYNRSFATQEQFTKYCETGDILLFRDNHTMAKVQRALTRSEYDHVAVVIKSDRLRICIFESNSATGVAMASWNHLIRYKWYQNIEKISWRRLNVKRSPEFEEVVQKFIGQNLGRQFGLTIPKLLRFQSLIVKDPQQEKTRTYFCTELVATLYKRLGLLQQQKSATQYWPKDFMDSGNIKLLRGHLQKQKHLIFEPKILEECYPYLKK